jgi:hypothetical protein
MRYDLWTAVNPEKIGDVLLDESPKVGATINFGDAKWRVTEIVWDRAAAETNSLSSGCVYVERTE